MNENYCSNLAKREICITLDFLMPMYEVLGKIMKQVMVVCYSFNKQISRTKGKIFVTRNFQGTGI